MDNKNEKTASKEFFPGWGQTGEHVSDTLQEAEVSRLVGPFWNIQIFGQFSHGPNQKPKALLFKYEV